MKTKILSSGEIQVAAEILKSGGLVAMPTETVYGLAANAMNPMSVKNIFKAKGRPSDNPLIVHISEFFEIYDLVDELPPIAKELAKAFWPGPLTMILKKSDAIPLETSGGLDTVAVRLPSNPIARKLISSAGVPLAAPSANLSGSPSPTKLSHVINDLDDKIDAILDGGDCKLGLESTVISLASKPPKLLRPGTVTFEQLKKVVPDICIDPAVLNGLTAFAPVSSPGMKYKHYAPRAAVIVVSGDPSKYINYVNSVAVGSGALALCYDEDIDKLKVPCVTYGKAGDYLEQATLFFDSLRKVDSMPNIKTVYARCPEPTGVGLAVYNRLIRAAGFKVITL